MFVMVEAAARTSHVGCVLGFFYLAVGSLKMS